MAGTEPGRYVLCRETLRSMRISEIGGENAVIELIRSRHGDTGSGPLALGIGDDAALIETGKHLLIVTTDLLIEGTHFRMDLIDPYSLGWKSAAVNISDVAAMGGEPTCCFVSIGLPDVDVAVVEQFCDGLAAVSARFGSVIAGGDTAGSALGIVVNITQLGTVEADMAAARTGAKPGDAILVTNTLGDSLAGLQMLLKHGLEESRKLNAFVVERHIRPEPRVVEARAATATGRVRSMMDLSDGLSSDLPRLCRASGVGARVYAGKLPVSDDLRNAAKVLGSDAVRFAAAGGEDYELLMTCAAEDAQQVVEAIETTGSTAAVIGGIVEGDGVVLVGVDGSEGPLPAGWQHFQ